MSLAPSADPGAAVFQADAPYVTQLRARHPELLGEGVNVSAALVDRTVRRGSGMVVVALCHRELSDAQRQALSAFRAQQFLLLGWYDTDAVLRASPVWPLIEDPSFEHLPTDTLHIVVGHPDGQILAYACLRPPATSCDGVPGKSPFVARRRALFPTEELFGPSLFASLPALAGVETRRAREMACVLRNATAPASLGAIAGIEVFATASRLVMRPQADLAAIVGHVDADARRVAVAMGIPVLYAPFAPIRSPYYEWYWSDAVREPGLFWPFVIGIADLRAHRPHLATIEAALDAPAGRVLAAVVRALRAPRAAPPMLMQRGAGRGGVFWTADPTFNVEMSPEAEERAAAGGPGGRLIRGRVG